MRRFWILALVSGCIDWDSLYGATPGKDAAPLDAPADAAPDAPAVPDVACSDGTREGLVGFSSIAACGGAWTVAGVVAADQVPTCGRAAGNTGTNAAGTGCDAADLCAEGYHVCRNKDDVTAHDGAAACAQLAGRSEEIYVTRQRGDHTTLTCAAGSSTMADDVYGCGGLGAAVTTCGVIDAKLALTGECPAPWGCGSGEAEEGSHVVKGVGPGGVLCCAD